MGAGHYFSESVAIGADGTLYATVYDDARSDKSTLFAIGP